MHEMGVARQMVGIALDAIPEDIPEPRVAVLNLRIGRLAAVVEDSLRFCFEILAKDSPLEGAELVIETVPVRVLCKTCGHQREVTGPVFTCPHCTEGDVAIVSGRELDIISLELAD